MPSSIYVDNKFDHEKLFVEYDSDPNKRLTLDTFNI